MAGIDLANNFASINGEERMNLSHDQSKFCSVALIHRF